MRLQFLNNFVKDNISVQLLEQLVPNSSTIVKFIQDIGK